MSPNGKIVKTGHDLRLGFVFYTHYISLYHCIIVSLQDVPPMQPRRGGVLHQQSKLGS